MRNASLIQKYLNGQRSAAHENYSNFGGNAGFGNPLQFAGSQQYFQADGAGAQPAAGASQPYILQISNSAASAVSNFDVLGASTYLQNLNANTGTWSAAGNLTVSGVTISSLIANVNYQDFLFQSATNQFTVGLTYVQAVVNTAQPFIPYTINTKDSNGNQALRTVTPILDPYQNQNGVSIDKTPYRIDGLTKITFTTILPSAVFYLFLFPAANVNPARSLGDGSQVKAYESPDVVRSNVAVIGSGAGGQMVANRIGR